MQLFAELKIGTPGVTSNLPTVIRPLTIESCPAQALRDTFKHICEERILGPIVSYDHVFHKDALHWRHTG